MAHRDARRRVLSPTDLALIAEVLADCETQPATDQFRWNIGHHTPP